MPEFVKLESYKHKCAKDVLQGWLKEGVPGVSFRPNRPCGGVWLEYPFARVPDGKTIVLNGKHYTTEGGNSWETNWDELILNEKREWGDNLGFVPTFEQCVEMNATVIAVIDIVCTHKGIPAYAIEVCHKHPVSQEKLKKIRDAGFTGPIYEIDADWILSQVQPPTKLKWTELDTLGQGPYGRLSSS